MDILIPFYEESIEIGSHFGFLAAILNFWSYMPDTRTKIALQTLTFNLVPKSKLLQKLEMTGARGTPLECFFRKEVYNQEL